MVARKETILVAIVTAVLVSAVIEVPEHWPVKVRAQERVTPAWTATVPDISNPSCSMSSAPTIAANGTLIPGGFVCVADLDGTGTKEIIFGSQSEVVIINNTGTVRKAIFPPY